MESITVDRFTSKTLSDGRRVMLAFGTDAHGKRVVVAPDRATSRMAAPLVQGFGSVSVQVETWRVVTRKDA